MRQEYQDMNKRITKGTLLLATISMFAAVSVVGQSTVQQARVLHIVNDTYLTANTDTLLFFPAVTYDLLGPYAKSVTIADVNGDEKPDLLVAVTNCWYDSSCGGAGSVDVLLGNGDGTYQTAQAFQSGGYGVLAVSVADVNRDGVPDVIAVNECGEADCFTGGSVGVLLGNGDGTFQTAVAYSSGGTTANAVAIGDINGDGTPDMIVTNGCGARPFYDCYSPPNGTVGVLLGNGDGTFQAPLAYDSGGFYPSSLMIADVNMDGRPDVVVANSCLSGCEAPGASVLGVLLGNGDGSFQAVALYPSGGYYGGHTSVSVVVADVNGDGKPDLIAANECATTPFSTSGSVGVLLGNGDGTFQPAMTYDSGGFGADSVVVADVNGDGKSDVLVTNFCRARASGEGNCSDPEGVLGVLLGNGDGTFQAAQTYDSAGRDAVSLAVRDMNGDGQPDVAIANVFPPLLAVLIHTAACTAPPAISVSVNPKYVWPPNGRMVPVAVSGTIRASGCGIKPGSAEYTVTDEYHLIQPQGKILLDANGNYSFTVMLRASRKGHDPNGRRYTIRVNAKDNAGNRAAKWKAVIVPRERPH